MEVTAKYEKLQELMRELNFVVKGLDNYPLDGRSSVVIANHSCIMDIFYLASAIPEPCASVLSSRLVYKNITRRKEAVNKYLNPMPLDGSGGLWANICLDAISRLIKENVTINIFPEGVLGDRSKIIRGRTGMARALFNACKMIRNFGGGFTTLRSSINKC